MWMDSGAASVFELGESGMSAGLALDRIGCVAALSLLAASASGAAHAESIRAQYSVSLLGLPIGSATAPRALGRAPYQIQIPPRPAGPQPASCFRIAPDERSSRRAAKRKSRQAEAAGRDLLASVVRPRLASKLGTPPSAAGCRRTCGAFCHLPSS